MHELVTLRLATMSDAQAIGTMSRDLIEQGLQWSWQPARVRRFIEDRESSVVVAQHEQRLVAFAIMRFAAESAHLNLLAVATEWRRLGLGRRLIDWLVASAQEAGVFRIDLELRAGNQPAQAFYEKLGFGVAGHLPQYYGGRETALKMSCDLRRSSSTTR